MWFFDQGLRVFQNYTLLQWAWFFMFYCIFGWCFESVYCSVKSLRLMNRGFCHGPWLPIYGAGSTLFLVFAWPYRDDLMITFLMGMLVGTTLELITGPLLYHIFRMRWWDYSRNPLNWHGYICLYASIGWGFMALFFVHFLHPHVAVLTKSWTPIGYTIVVTMLYTLFIEDLIFSVLGALDIRKRLERLADNSAEIRQLKLSIAEARLRMEELQDTVSANVSEVKEIAENEGTLAAARAVSESTAQTARALAEGSAQAARSLAESSAQAARSLAETGGHTARSIAKTSGQAARNLASGSAQAAKTLAETGGQAARGVASTGMLAGRSVGNAGKSAVQRSLELRKRHMEEKRRRMEERLAILEDGGTAETGRMSWWVGNTLRNNPTAGHHGRHKESAEALELLRASSHRYRESFEKMEARLEDEKAKDAAGSVK